MQHFHGEIRLQSAKEALGCKVQKPFLVANSEMRTCCSRAFAVAAVLASWRRSSLALTFSNQRGGFSSKVRLRLSLGGDDRISALSLYPFPRVFTGIPIGIPLQLLMLNRQISRKSLELTLDGLTFPLQLGPKL